ncbi:MAG: NAD-dependent epimerase/dehydratase family protein [Bacteroidales bacterium]|nr:NAD-dependent epimerase/dehydratase family protein [Bacteroidales bacterium]
MSQYQEDIKAVTHLELPWGRLSGKNILVTGATGLIGSCLVDVLMHREGQDYHVYASGRDEHRIQHLFSKISESPFFHFLKYDVTQPLILDVDFHYIINAASGANPILYSTNPVGVMKANIYGTDNLLSFGVKHNMEKFVYISSGDVYGEGDGRDYTEEYSGYVNPLELRSCYTSAKRAAETLCISYAQQYNIKVNIARPCHTYGPNFTASDTRVYAQFLRNIIHNEDIVMKSSGEQFRSWCYVVDVVSGILYVLLKGEKNEAYNIADEKSNITIKELAEMIAEIGGKKVVVDVPSDTEKRGYNFVKKATFSTSKLKGLGWSVNGTMYEKMCNTIEQLREYLS